jgi:hypothetical protein
MAAPMWKCCDLPAGDLAYADRVAARSQASRPAIGMPIGCE